jgi:O-antigen ligase
MLTLLVFALVAVSIFALITLLLWQKVNFTWLQTKTRFLILSLPFERIPSLELEIATIRISQILALTGFYFLLILIIKNDRQLLNQKINQSLWLILAFILASTTSWFFILSPSRFLSTTIATWLTFGGFFLIANFTKDILQRLKELLLVMFGVGVFGYYQLVADFVGFPPLLTGLRETYTKEVFGIARVHSTAIEPQYFAGMLFVPIFTLCGYILAGQKVFEKVPKWMNPLLLVFFLLLFFITISKGAILVLALCVPYLIFLAYQKFNLARFLKQAVSLIFFAVVSIVYATLISVDLQVVFSRVFKNFYDSFVLQSVSAVERSRFIDAGLALLPDKILSGFGSGQFGVYALTMLPDLAKGEPSLIINNVYLEVWLENGLLALLVFLIMLILPQFQGLKQSFDGKIKTANWSLTTLILLSVMFAYSLQWIFFSPVYIMPIFITLGLCYAHFNQSQLCLNPILDNNNQNKQIT